MIAPDQHGLFRWLDLRLRFAVDSLRDDIAARAGDPFQGLVLTDAEVDALLASTPACDSGPAKSSFLPCAADSERLSKLAGAYGLTPFEQQALLICLAPEIDLRYERLYAYLQDDITRRRPSVELIMRLARTPPVQQERPPVRAHPVTSAAAERIALSPSGTLLSEGLLVLADEAASAWPLLARPLRPDEQITDYLLGANRPDPRLRSVVRCLTDDANSSVGLPAELTAGLQRVMQGPLPAVVYFFGQREAASAVAAEVSRLDRELLLVDAEALLAAASPSDLWLRALREAFFRHAIPALDRFDRLFEPTREAAALGAAIQRTGGRRCPLLLFGNTPWEPAVWFPNGMAVRIELPPVPSSARLAQWRAAFDGAVPADELATLAERFRLDGTALRAASRAAESHAAWRGASAPTPEEIGAAARAIAAPTMGTLAVRQEPRYGWDDIVLPNDGQLVLRDFCTRAANQQTVLETWGFGRKHVRRAGLTALFAGPPGTGKTMAAEVVACALGLDLFRIDLSSVVSKYLGETEQNLERIFRAADRGAALLLFDEADALFGKRSDVRDAHDRYANIETAYLLQRLERYEGIAILTTNMRGNLDEAFLRRLDCVLEFTLPEEAERLAIWQRALPPEAPVAGDLDLPSLARRVRLSGGHIRNIALTAAYLAAAEHDRIGMHHITRATRREYQKLGKLASADDIAAPGARPLHGDAPAR